MEESKDNHLLDSFKRDVISLGQLANTLHMTKKETMVYLEKFNIPVTDYDLNEELKKLEKFME